MDYLGALWSGASGELGLFPTPRRHHPVLAQEGERHAGLLLTQRNVNVRSGATVDIEFGISRVILNGEALVKSQVEYSLSSILRRLDPVPREKSSVKVLSVMRQRLMSKDLHLFASDIAVMLKVCSVIRDSLGAEAVESNLLPFVKHLETLLFEGGARLYTYCSETVFVPLLASFYIACNSDNLALDYTMGMIDIYSQSEVKSAHCAVTLISIAFLLSEEVNFELEHCRKIYSFALGDSLKQHALYYSAFSNASSISIQRLLGGGVDLSIDDLRLMYEYLGSFETVHRRKLMDSSSWDFLEQTVESTEVLANEPSEKTLS